jgi:hypothetical protein
MMDVREMRVRMRDRQMGVRVGMWVGVQLGAIAARCLIFFVVEIAAKSRGNCDFYITQVYL